MRIIGAGSNLLVNDAGIKGIVVKLSMPSFKKVVMLRQRNDKVSHRVVSVGAGTSLMRLVNYARKFGLSGCRLLAGIPGTVGGALIMNSGNIGNNVLQVLVMDRLGRIKILKRQDIRFGYRSSNLNRYIILGAHLKLIKKNKKAVAGAIKEYLSYRRKTQDLSLPSAGCAFKNPDAKSVLRLRSGLMVSEAEPSAAYFIERCGLKNFSFGDAAVSVKHANFIVNKGRASFSDIKRLMSYIARQVRKKFNINLEPEIKIWRD